MLDAMLDVGSHVYFLFKFRQMREYLLWDAAWLIYIAWPNRHKMSATVRMLRFHLGALVFATLYKEIFKRPKRKSPRDMFGAPYHSIVCHIPKLYWIVLL